MSVETITSPAAPARAAAGPTWPHPYMHPGWIAFNERKWHLTAQHVHLGSAQAGETGLDAVLYTNAAGTIRPVPHNLYCPVAFHSTPTHHAHSQTRQWIETSGKLADVMTERGVHGVVPLGIPGIDARAWQWHGFRVSLLYCYIVPLPFDSMAASGAIRRAINKGKREAYTCERTDDIAAVLECILATEARRGFTQGVTGPDLALLRQLMGEDHCRLYLCRAANGEPATSHVVLHTPGAAAIDWLTGTVTSHLATRSTQLLDDFILADLHAAGATGLNFGGANLPELSTYKAEWGGDLTPYIAVSSNSLHTLARDTRAWTRRTAEQLRTHLPRRHRVT